MAFAIMQSMNLLDRLETLVQRVIEGAFNRLFQSQLAPTIAHENGNKKRAKTEERISVIPPQEANHWLLRLGERELRLGEPVVRIGRALDNDIVLTDPTVSRYHAQLRWREGCYHLCPPPPTNGDAVHRQADDNYNENQPIPQTTVNHQVAIWRPLTSEDVIILGDTKLTVMVERGTV